LGGMLAYLTSREKPSMLHRRFGRTELKISVFSCGGMRYQYKWQDLPMEEIPQENQDNLEATIRRALEVGINHIETAHGYGSSERQLSRILPTLPRDQFIFQTKVGPKKDPTDFRREFEESLDRIKLDYVDLLGLHGINNEEILEWSVRPEGCFDVAQQLQEEGKVRFIGFSTHAPTDVIVKAIEHENKKGGFDYVNLHWYYIFQGNWPAIQAARKRDMGVFIISPTEKGGKLFDPSPKLVELCKPFHPIVFNDLFCLSHPEVHTLSIGAARPSDFDLHIEALDYLDKADKVLPPIIERLEVAWKEALGNEFADRWQEGLPRWENTPGNVNIPIILWLRNLAVAYDMIEYGKMRYNLLGNAEHWFPGKNALEMNPVKISKALNGHPFAEQIPGHLQEAHQLLYTEPKKRLSEE